MQPSNETILIRRERVFLILAGIFLCAMTMLNLLGITRFVEARPLDPSGWGAALSDHFFMHRFDQ